MTQTDESPITRRELDLALREQRLDIVQNIAQLGTGIKGDLDRIEGRLERLDRSTRTELDQVRTTLDQHRIATKGDLDQFRAEVGRSLDRVLASLAELRQNQPRRWWPF